MSLYKRYEGLKVGRGGQDKNASCTRGDEYTFYSANKSGLTQRSVIILVPSDCMGVAGSGGGFFVESSSKSNCGAFRRVFGLNTLCLRRISVARGILMSAEGRQ